MSEASPAAANNRRAADGADSPGNPPVARDDEPGGWHLRGVGATAFALALWLAGVGGLVLFSREGIEVAWARAGGVLGTVTIETCAHSSSYALCYGPFDAADGSVHKQRIELRTVRHTRPGVAARTWLPSRTATHAWDSDVDPWRQLLPAGPFALLALIQTVWIGLSWRAWRRRRRRRREAALPRPVGVATVVPPSAPSAMITTSHQEHPHRVTGGTDRQPLGWQDLRGTAAQPGSSIPHQRARRQPWEISEDG